ncbi:MAG TPA: hypothetical protein VE398_08545, partial [Acidobacteriota bacterium]|nr:hypothetical protein [Acidobacteriota bacterium]
RLRSAENYWVPVLTQRMVSIYRAARSVFGDALVLPGSTNIVICSVNPLQRDPAVSVERLLERRIAARLVSPAFIQYLYRNDRFSQVARILETGSAPENTDARPICYQYTAVLWLSKFYPAMTRMDFSGIAARAVQPALRDWLGFGVSLVLLTLIRSRPALRRALFMGLTGLLGMLVETTLILHYQVKNGVLFQDLGVLLMSFMAGLTMGAIAMGPEARAQCNGALSRFSIAGLVLVLSFIPLGVWIAYRSNTGAGMGLMETSVLLAASGFLVAGVFAYASKSRSSHQQDLIAPLYSADVIGGCIGSVAGTLFLIPILGLAATSIWMIPFAILAALLA